jgi:hypothetical protein
MMILKPVVVYFALVFGAGFVLGPIRILWVVPRLGTRTAELMESPIMLGVTIAAAHWTVLKFAVPPNPALRLGIGLLALTLLVIVELSLVRVRGLSIREYISKRDPLSGSVYYALLAIFAIMPVMVARR